MFLAPLFEGPLCNFGYFSNGFIKISSGLLKALIDD